MDDLTNDTAVVKGAKGSNGNPNANASGKLVLPEVKPITGVVTKVSPVLTRASSGSRFRKIAIGTGDELSISETLFQQNSQLLQEGAEVVVEVEARIAGQTSYVDRTTGAVIKHDNTSLGFLSVKFQEGYVLKRASAKAEHEKELDTVAIRTNEAKSLIDLIRQSISESSEKDKHLVATAIGNTLKISR